MSRDRFPSHPLRCMMLLALLPAQATLAQPCEDLLTSIHPDQAPEFFKVYKDLIQLVLPHFTPQQLASMKDPFLLPNTEKPETVELQLTLSSLKEIIRPEQARVFLAEITKSDSQRSKLSHESKQERANFDSQFLFSASPNSSATFSPDGRWLALLVQIETPEPHQLVELWDLKTQTRVNQLDPFVYGKNLRFVQFTSLHFSTKDSTLYINCNGAQVFRTSIRDGNFSEPKALNPEFNKYALVGGSAELSISTDEKWTVGMINQADAFGLFNLTLGTFTEYPRNSKVRTVAISPSGNELAYLGGEGGGIVPRSDPGQILYKNEKLPHPLWAKIAFLPDESGFVRHGLNINSISIIKKTPEGGLEEHPIQELNGYQSTTILPIPGTHWILIGALRFRDDLTRLAVLNYQSLQLVSWTDGAQQVPPRAIHSLPAKNQFLSVSSNGKVTKWNISEALEGTP